MEKVLVTGGCGYIGAHTTLVLLEAGYEVHVLDSLVTSGIGNLRAAETITGRTIKFIEGDIRDKELLKKIFQETSFQSVLHFAGLKSVADSVRNPLTYYDNNVYGTQVLLSMMEEFGVFNFVFSSSATVYGTQERLPIPETAATAWPMSPYGCSKLMIERMLTDLADSEPGWNIAVLRYFNPVGAHQAGLIGEDLSSGTSNLMPAICKVALGQQSELEVFGVDYDSEDGTGVRDYIHVMDLAYGHVRAMSGVRRMGGLAKWNLGTGKGVTVLEMIREFERASDVSIPRVFRSRRVGDISVSYADPKQAQRDLGWRAQASLQTMMLDTVRYLDTTYGVAWRCKKQE